MAKDSLRSGAIRKEMLPHCVQRPGVRPPQRAGLCQAGSRSHTKPRPPRAGPPTHPSREPGQHASGAEQTLTPNPSPGRERGIRADGIGISAALRRFFPLHPDLPHSKTPSSGPASQFYLCSSVAKEGLRPEAWGPQTPDP